METLRCMKMTVCLLEKFNLHFNLINQPLIRPCVSLNPEIDEKLNGCLAAGCGAHRGMYRFIWKGFVGRPLFTPYLHIVAITHMVELYQSQPDFDLIYGVSITL